MTTLNDAQITAKCVEISKCLVDTKSGFVDFDLRNSCGIGDAARLAVSIRLAGEIDEETLAGISAALKLDFRLVRSEILSTYEGLGWASVNKKNRIITEHIPPTEDIISQLGRLWREQEPTPVDEATVNGLQFLSKSPFEKTALLSELGVAQQKFDAFLDYGVQAHYLGQFTSKDQKETIWTPLYWAGKEEQVRKFLEKQSEKEFPRLASLTRSFRDYPGTPEEKVPNDPLVDAGISYGYFPSIAITDRRQGKHEYVFASTPQFEVDPKKDIFEKARLIVACIRHGQHHAEVSPILYPRSILNCMRHNSMKPHPYADVQYALLKLHGMVTLEAGANRYGAAVKVKWIDTPENNLAADIADELLRGEEPVVRSKEELEAKKVFVKGMVNYSSEQRRIRAADDIHAKNEFNRLLESVAGVRR